MFSLLASVALAIPLASALSCRTIPGDSDWPSDRSWARLNRTVDGRLMKAVPLGAACFGDAVDEEVCAEIKDKWTVPDLFLENPATIMHTSLLNKTCDPFAGPGAECSTEAYPAYAINVQTPRDAMAGFRFAKQHNIRVVIKNTGHDYMGRSSGAGALTLWTHNLKSTEWMDDYRSRDASYRGPAVKVAAGVQGGQLYSEGQQRGYIAVGGLCPSVGFAGGYFQGGGASYLSSKWGMAADQVLAMEVITPKGHLVTATPRRHADLFWAVRGGGGGTFGLLWSVTIRVFPDTPMGLMTASYTREDNDEDTFWAAYSAYSRLTLEYNTRGIATFGAFNSEFFAIPGMVYPNATMEEVEEVTSSLFAAWDSLGLVYTHNLQVLPTYWDTLQNVLFEPSVNDGTNGGRLFPPSVYDTEEAADRYTSIAKQIADSGTFTAEITTSPGFRGAGIEEYGSAIYPQWRTAGRLAFTTHPSSPTDTLEDVLADRDHVTNFTDKLLKSVLPSAGAYMNEADVFDPDWKESFYGENYDRLLSIKDRYDPDQLLYGTISVGGDRWVQTDEGRLCPV